MKTKFWSRLAILLFLVAIRGSLAAASSDYPDNPRTKDFVEVKKFSAKDHGPTFVIVRMDGHVMGMPFIVEFRPDCKNSGKGWRRLEVADSESACAIKRETLDFDQAQGTIQVEIFKTDEEVFNRDSKVSPETAFPVCSKKSEIFKIKVLDLCE